MKRFISLILSLCALYGFVPGARAQEGVSGEKTVYMVLWDGCEDACRGFQDYLKTARVPVRIVFLDAHKDRSKLASFVSQVREKRPDLLVTWGSLVTLEMLGAKNDGRTSRYVRSVPAVFMVVSQPVESGLVSGIAAQGRNITGVTHLVPVAEQLQAARQFIPYKRLGIIYNPAETNASVTVEQIKSYAPIMNFEVVDRKVPFKPDGRPDEKAIADLTAELAEKKVELIYLGTDAFMNAHRDLLTETASSLNIPVLSASEGAVRRGGALFAFVHRYYTVGQMAGRKATEILRDGIAAYDIPIESPQRSLFVVNMEAAERLGIYPPLNLLQNADLVNPPD